jgi:hypothetical protein
VLRGRNSAENFVGFQCKTKAKLGQSNELLAPSKSALLFAFKAVNAIVRTVSRVLPVALLSRPTPAERFFAHPLEWGLL